MGEVLLYFRMMQAYLTTRCTDEDASCTPGISYVSKDDIQMSVTKSAGIIFSRMKSLAILFTFAELSYFTSSNISKPDLT